MAIIPSGSLTSGRKTMSPWDIITMLMNSGSIEDNSVYLLMGLNLNNAWQLADKGAVSKQ